VCTNEVLQRIRTQVDDVDGRRGARTNVASGNGQTRSMYECRKAVHTDEVLQRVRTQVSGVDCIRAARTNVGEQYVPTSFCNAYECRSTMKTADEQHVRM